MANPTIPEVEIQHVEGGKWIIDYQPTDEAGQPIGRRTHIEADTQQELIQKQIQVNLMAVRAMHKAKPDISQAEKVKAATTIVKPTADEDNVRQVQLQDPGQRRNVVVADVEAAIGMPLKDLAALPAEVQRLRTREIASGWLYAHKGDYYQCDANDSVLQQYVKANQLAFTHANLDLAFEAVMDQLIPVPAAQTIPAETNTPTRQRQVPSGLIPGETRINTPADAPGLTWKEVDEMPYGALPEKMRTDKKFAAAFQKLSTEHPRGKRR